ncbi:F-box and leucine-rich protein 22 isoform X1 [Suricata suricatta]|uniref:F-box and leucine-rich protein 22 isoform X1 n=1 Tax=Suricata suricatta TaxID=37032 RepID=UPI001155B967|nr:F-box and leucine-rich protein 22 isoform X1 [Suricata suricatta]XP_029808758.1 F-box and leucine-rich protein 22 isoform X1 [Suricata suricatta]
MHLTQLNRECLLHLFSFLDKDSRKNLARTCPQLQDVFEDPTLWPLLHFHSLIELKKDNFLLSPALRSLSICWYSSRVQVCSIEDWLKSAFQRSICSQHESLVNDFLFQVCDRPKADCPGLSTAQSPEETYSPAGSSSELHTSWSCFCHKEEDWLQLSLSFGQLPSLAAMKTSGGPAGPDFQGVPTWRPSRFQAAAMSPTTASCACCAAASTCACCAWRTARASPTAR